MENNNNIENKIFLSIKEKAKNLSQAEIKKIITEELKKNDYEDWQIDYAVERITNKIEKENQPEKEISLKEDKKDYIYSFLLSLCFYFFFQLTFGIIGIVMFFISFVVIKNLISNKKAKGIIINLAISAIASPLVSYGIFSSFDSTEELNPLLVILILLIIFAILEIARFIWKKMIKKG
jgi:Fe2+ transport system protein B